MINLDLNDLEILLAAARTEHRNITRVREDLRRLDLSDIDVNDGLYTKQEAVYQTIAKVQAMIEEIKA